MAARLAREAEEHVMPKDVFFCMMYAEIKPHRNFVDKRDLSIVVKHWLPECQQATPSTELMKKSPVIFYSQQAISMYIEWDFQLIANVLNRNASNFIGNHSFICESIILEQQCRPLVCLEQQWVHANDMLIQEDMIRVSQLRFRTETHEGVLKKNRNVITRPVVLTWTPIAGSRALQEINVVATVNKGASQSSKDRTGRGPPTQ